MDREAWRATVHGVAQELDMTEYLSTKGIGKLFRCSCETKSGQIHGQWSLHELRQQMN